MKFGYDSGTGFRLCDQGTVVISGWQPWLESDGGRLAPDHIEEVRPGLEYKLYFAGRQLVWHWHIELTDGRLCLQSSLRNGGAAAYSLGRIAVLDAEPTALNIPEHDIVALGSLPGASGQMQRAVRCIKAEDAPRESMIKFQYFDRTAGRALQVGFLTFRHRHTISSYEPDMARVQAYCDFAAWRLEPGAETVLETFTIAWGSDPYRQLEEWADLVAEVVRPVFRDQAALGYLGWAWSMAPEPGETSEERLLANAAALREKLGGFGFEYLWVSIANLPGGNPGAWTEWNYGNLPDGLDGLVGKLAEHGLKLGLWCGPFYLSSALTELVRELDDALLRDENGNYLVVCERWRHGDAGKLPPAQRPALYALDPTHPAAQAFIRRAFEFYREHGVRYYMLDFLEAGAGMLGRFPYRKHHDGAVGIGPEALGQFLSVIREAAGADTFLLGSTGPTLHCTGHVDAMRTGNDFGEGRPIHPEAFFYPASFVINGVRFWTGPGWAIRNMAANYYTHRKLYLNDSGNVLTVDQPVPLEDARIYAAIHGFSGASSMLGDDLRYIRPERLELIKKTLPRSPEVAVPVDLFTLPDNEVPRMFRHRISRNWGSWQVYVMFNLSEKTEDYRIDADGEFLIWEFWNERYCGQKTGTAAMGIPAGTVRIFRVAPVTGRPQIIGTDMHMAMGEMEIADCVWNEAEMSLEIGAVRPAGESGSVFVHVPCGFFIRNNTDCFVAKDANDASLILRIPYEFTADGICRKKIYFGRIGEETSAAQEGEIEKFA